MNQSLLLDHQPKIKIILNTEVMGITKKIEILAGVFSVPNFEEILVHIQRRLMFSTPSADAFSQKVSVTIYLSNN